MTGRVRAVYAETEAQVQARLVGWLVDEVGRGLDPVMARTVLQAAPAWPTVALRELDRHVTLLPDARCGPPTRIVRGCWPGWRTR